jgi:hypothetical protein
MTITTQSSNIYSPLVPDAINQAFNAVWATLYAHVAPENNQAHELKIALSQTLAALASDGITDPRELRRRALESMALSVR